MFGCVEKETQLSAEMSDESEAFWEENLPWRLKIYNDTIARNNKHLQPLGEGAVCSTSVGDVTLINPERL